jgi:hypothetical protein
VLCQGDQIGRLFAYWAIVCFDHLFENYRSSRNVGTAFFHGKSYASVFTKHWLGYLLGAFYLTHLVTLQLC